MRIPHRIIPWLALLALFTFNPRLTVTCAADIDPTFSDANWSALGAGIKGGWVSALAVSGNTVYAGGYFTNAGIQEAKNIAKWSGKSWTSLSSGMNGEVYALAVSGTNLYAGGAFTMAGGVAATNIAEWNGSYWTNLGSGMDGEVYALALSGTNLYAGGQFVTAGGVAASRIAQWNGVSWTNLGGGMDFFVHALLVSGTNLYAGGDFYQVFNDNFHMHAVVANGIAQWNGSSWTNLGSGMDSVYREYSEPAVWALAVLGTNLYAGGHFTSAGGMAATNIAVWNGSSWTNLGEGLGVGLSGFCGLQVAALVVSGTNLYAGGCFTNSGGAAVNNIALWDGSSWLTMGSGVDQMIQALAVSDNTLYAGGEFTMAGGVAANSVAQAIIGPPILTISIVNSMPDLSWKFIPRSTNLVWATTNSDLSLAQWQAIATNVASSLGLFLYIDRNTAGIDAKFYRVSAP
jgi:hypothetical protein